MYAFSACSKCSVADAIVVGVGVATGGVTRREALSLNDGAGAGCALILLGLGARTGLLGRFGGRGWRVGVGDFGAEFRKGDGGLLIGLEGRIERTGDKDLIGLAGRSGSLISCLSTIRSP